MKTLTAVCILTLLAVPARVRAGHELPYYPSFYPHEIRLPAGWGAGPCPAPLGARQPAPPRAAPIGGAVAPPPAPEAPPGRATLVSLFPCCTTASPPPPP